MTAPDQPAWTVADDSDGDLTLWHGDAAVLRKYELGPPWRGGSEGYPDRLWSVLTAVLAPDEATVERLAEAVGRGAAGRAAMREIIPKVLAALAGTSAQARHTADATAGGGEHG